MPDMRTLFVDPPPEVEELIAQRKALGQDLYDEVWEGEYHVAPAPTGGHADFQVQLAVLLRPHAQRAGLWLVGPTNVGGPTDFRVPDATVYRERIDRVWNPTAAIVVEVVSPGDDTRRKLGFYHGVGVEEVLIVDPEGRTVEWLVRGEASFAAASGSALLGLAGADLAAVIDWPPRSA
jgi:Uma2 family endonuclease